MISITQRTLLAVFLVLEFCDQSLSGQSKLFIISNKRRDIPVQKMRQFSKGKSQNNLSVKNELTVSNGEKRDMTVTRKVEKDGTTTDTVKVDDQKKQKLIPVKVYDDETKTERAGQRIQTILVPNVQLSKLQLSPQQKLPSTPGGQISTKLLDRLPDVKPFNPVGPVAPVVQPSHIQRYSTQVINQCFNGTICIERICFRPHPTIQCPSASKLPTNALGIPPALPPSSTKLVPSTTATTPTCCSCPGICVDVNLCAKQLPICSALPRCATGQCAQNCCGR